MDAVTDRNIVRLEGNVCPYCTYECEAAGMIGGNDSPSPFDLSFCLMCSQASQFGEDMKLIKFDLDSVTDIRERVRLRGIQQYFDEFWESNPDVVKDNDALKRRKHYLSIMESGK